MSEIDTVYTKKYDVFTYLGWAACGVIFLTQLFWEFIYNTLNVSIQLQIGSVVSKIAGIFGVILLISYLNYVRQLPETQMYLVGGLLAGSALIQIIDVFARINLGVVSFLIKPVLLIPVVIFFIYYWKYGLLPKILAGAFSFRILMQLIIGVIYLFAYPPLFLYKLRRYAYLITLLLIAYWFFLGIPDLKGATSSSVSSSTRTISIPTPISSGGDTHMETGTGTGSGIYPSTSGWTHGMPRLAFWCETCDKKVNYRAKNKDDIGNEHPCPTCGTTIKAWWVEPTRDSYFKFIGGGLLVFGAMMTIMFETNFGSYGLDPLTMLMTLSIIEMAIGIFIMYSGIKLAHTGPPAYATTKVSLEPQKAFIQEMIILVVTMFSGSAIVYGINMGLLGIFFG
ncbi:MAG: hypothetical protein ACTSWW_04120 [Promethearchaeota archaeon]